MKKVLLVVVIVFVVFGIVSAQEVAEAEAPSFELLVEYEAAKNAEARDLENYLASDEKTDGIRDALIARLLEENLILNEENGNLLIQNTEKEKVNADLELENFMIRRDRANQKLEDIYENHKLDSTELQEFGLQAARDNKKVEAEWNSKVAELSIEVEVRIEIETPDGATSVSNFNTTLNAEE